MKQINVYFDDAEHKSLTNLKKELSWHDFILLMCTHCKESEKRGEFEVLKWKIFYIMCHAMTEGS